MIKIFAVLAESSSSVVAVPQFISTVFLFLRNLALLQLTLSLSLSRSLSIAPSQICLGFLQRSRHICCRFLDLFSIAESKKCEKARPRFTNVLLPTVIFFPAVATIFKSVLASKKGSELVIRKSFATRAVHCPYNSPVKSSQFLLLNGFG
jgi:hypothetical protein